MKDRFIWIYEKFLMNLFDFVVKLLSKTEVNWYPKASLGFDEEWKKRDLLLEELHELQRTNDELNYDNINFMERIEELEKRLYFYEPWNEEEEEN